MSNDNNDDQRHNAHMGQSAEWNAEAKALARAAEADRQNARQTRPLPPPSDVIPASALPPGLSPQEQQEYIARMTGRAKASSPRDYQSSRDFTGGVPRLDPKNVNPRSPWGSTRSLANLEPNGTVEITGTQISAEHAVRLGVLLRNPAGGYLLPSDAESAAREQSERQAQESEQQEQHPDQKADVKTRQEDGDLPDNNGMVAIMAVREAVAPEVFSSIARDAVTNGGTLSLANVIEAGQRAGMSAEQAQASATGAYEGYRRQAEAAARSVGVAQAEMGELWSWAQERYQSEHMHSVLSLVEGGGTAGIKDLARKFAAYRRGNR